MLKTEDLIRTLTEPSLPSGERRNSLRQFIDVAGWRPSHEIESYPGTDNLANGHVIIEHGLDNAAVITFLKSSQPYRKLERVDQLRLLRISYNNLVDWHLFPDNQGLTRVYNRYDPPQAKYISLEEQANVWRSEAFSIITDQRPNPNIKSLDNALIDTISYWKRCLASELGKKIQSKLIASLFNSIILIRAFEDHKRYTKPNEEQLLLEQWKSKQGPITIRKCIVDCFRILGINRVSNDLFDEKTLKDFDALDRETVQLLLYDFYQNRFTPYHYDFSLMSVHALSRIYEHYVSLLREKEPEQTKLFPDLPEEITNRDLGSYYTPQFIPRFFARYLKENTPPRVFRSMKVADPSCGSGIFLRALLEMQCDPFQEVDMTQKTKEVFSNLLGIDVDENACEATKLSLSLLHLSLTQEFPQKLNIHNEDAIYFYNKKRGILNTYDVVITNPPFIPWQRLTPNRQQQLRKLLSDFSYGRLDLFMGLLKIGLEMVKPGGYLLYILPHSFLIAKNTNGLRKKIQNDFWIRFLADLSEIPVFKSTGVYTILLIVQKKCYELSKDFDESPHATVVLCRDFVGNALQDALEGKITKTNFYNIFQVSQTFFDAKEWQVLTPEQTTLTSKIRRYPKLEEFLEIREGFITGADEIFIRNKHDIPKNEQDVYRPYLSDRDMMRYVTPKETDRVVFYPYIGNEKVTEDELEEFYPDTWKYLISHKMTLESRKSVLTKNGAWWSPVRPRIPQNMMRPKIIVPHLILLPKFSLDTDGRYAVSRCPLMYPKTGIEVEATDYLKYFLGILNSSVVYWQIAHTSHKYSKGYLMLEPKTLKQILVPNPVKVPVAKMKKIQQMIDKLLVNPEDNDLHIELDDFISDLYGLHKSEKNEIGMPE